MARPRTSSGSSGIGALVDNFVAAVHEATLMRVKSAILNALGGFAPAAGGRPGAGRASGPRRKQLCPVPGCKNPAAPVFGMVCRDHKGVSKAKIKKYREARRQQAAQPKRGPGRPPGSGKRKSTSKPSRAAGRPRRATRQPPSPRAVSTKKLARTAAPKAVQKPAPAPVQEAAVAADATALPP